MTKIRGKSGRKGTARSRLLFSDRLLGFLVLGLNAATATADTLPATQGDVQLVITVAVGKTNHENAVPLDMTMLQSLPSVEINTKTPWTEGVQNIDTQRYPIMIAYRHNGSPMSIRKLGPLRIMFPFDDYPELLTPKNESNALWQLVSMELL